MLIDVSSTSSEICVDVTVAIFRVNIRMINKSTHFFVLFYPLAYPYQDDNSVAAATADGGNPCSSPLLELSCDGGLVENVSFRIQTKLTN